MADAKSGDAEDIPEEPSAALPSADESKPTPELEAKEVEEEGALAKEDTVGEEKRSVKGGDEEEAVEEVAEEAGALVVADPKSAAGDGDETNLKLADDEYTSVVIRPDARFDAEAGALVATNEETWEEEEVEIHPEIQRAVQRMQCRIRMTIARNRILKVVRNRFELVFDPETGEYFYYDRVTAESQWTKPRILRAHQLYDDSPQALAAASTIQRLFRRKLALRKIAEMIQAQFSKEYDPKTGDFYYLNKKTGAVQWDKPASSIVPSVEVTMDEDSSMLLQKDKEIQRLRQTLALRDQDVEDAKNARLDELEAERQSKKIVVALRGAKRHRDMDLWEPEHVCAWFTEIESLEQYCPAVIKNRVDGLLLLNMETQDFDELGMTSKLHQRRLEVALKKYKIRYEQKQAGEGNEEDGSDSDFSDSGSDTPSELAEEEGEQMLDSEEEQEVHIPSDDELVPTEEELLELEQDKLHMKVKTKFPSQRREKPKVGDIVRCHFIVSLEDGTLVDSSRKNHKRPFEFIVGKGQVVRGWDRAIVRVNVEERVQVTLDPHYAYGDEGYPPSIPGGSTLVIDIELLAVRKRPYWFKPLIQPPGLSQRPFCPEDYYERGGPDEYENTHSTLWRMNQEQAAAAAATAPTGEDFAVAAVAAS